MCVCVWVSVFQHAIYKFNEMVLVNVLGKWRVLCTNRLFKICFSFQLMLLFFFRVEKTFVLFTVVVWSFVSHIYYFYVPMLVQNSAVVCSLQFSIATYVIFIILFSIAWLPVLVHFYSKTNKNERNKESERANKKEFQMHKNIL